MSIWKFPCGTEASIISAENEGRWLLIVVDLPSRSKAQRTTAQKFRYGLLDLGYGSVGSASYTKYFPMRSTINVEIKRICEVAPQKGIVRVFELSNAAYRRSRLLVDGVAQHCMEKAEFLTIY